MPSTTFFLFLLTGGFSAAVNWGSRIVYNMWMPYSYAIVLAYLTGMACAFVLAKTFVFTTSSQTTGRSALLFALVNVAAVAQTWAVSMLLAFHVFPALGMTWYAREIAHAIGVAVPVFTSYVGHKRLTFKK